MILLSKEQRDLLLDYYFRCVSDEHTVEARLLLSSHSGAVEFYEKLRHSLSALDHLHSEKCPAHLVDATVDKLYEHHAATSGQGRLEELLDAEQSRIVTARPSFWRNIYEIAATAAAILVIAGVFFPVTRNMRFSARQIQCEANLSGLGQSISSYANDHAGALPTVATAAGAPWWKVGAKGTQNQSNTRHLWLLVKENYAEPGRFVCAGRRCKGRQPLDEAAIAKLDDFPSRKYITYSFMLINDAGERKISAGITPLMADANPIFEGCASRPDCYERNEFEPVKLSDKLMQANSRNHRGKGQNVMLSDGSILFMKNRIIETSTDDIFTIKDEQTYRRVESPISTADIFLVP